MFKVLINGKWQTFYSPITAAWHTFDAMKRGHQDIFDVRGSLTQYCQFREELTRRLAS